MPEATVNSFRFCLAALFVVAASVTPAAADPAKTSSIPFLGEKPGDAAIRTKLVNDIRQFPAGERIALLEITLLCELDRPTLGRRSLYDAWEKRCKRTEGIWNAKYRKLDDRRMIDVQMRLYYGRRLSLVRSTLGYFTQKETIARKIRGREDVSKDVKEAVRRRKELIGISRQILRFFFTLRDLIAESRK
ncbi:MAG: hypothetical protein O7F14_02370 [Alphaproteobacteria bacterium]|nr:hypothetical protein [Alphaproteobacteria bacterium]